eukprot:757099-Hanusia_phi.AAC.2
MARLGKSSPAEGEQVLEEFHQQAKRERMENLQESAFMKVRAARSCCCLTLWTGPARAAGSGQDPAGVSPLCTRQLAVAGGLTGCRWWGRSGSAWQICFHR